MKPAQRISASLFVLFCLALHAENSVAPAAVLSSKALQAPVVFRSFLNATNVMTREFLAAFANARTNFNMELAVNFHSKTLDAAAVSSADFGYLITAFNVKNRSFPVTDELAAEWAHGSDGEAIQVKLLRSLMLAADRPVCPDDLPGRFTIGDTIRLVPVADMNQKLSLDEVERGKLTSSSSLTTVLVAQTFFRNEFPEAQQPFARALSVFIKPNCFPDVPTTQLVRGPAVHQAMMPSPPTGHTQPRQMPELETHDTSHSQVLETPAQVLNAGVHGSWLAIVLTGISAVGLFVAWRQFSLGRQIPTSVSQAPPQPPVSTNTELAQEMAQALRDAVMQELALQRRELLLSQQAAADEIAALVSRLDELQVPMQERERAYEIRIQALEKELAVRTEENRELLKMKIEMVRRQLETERADNRVHFN